MDRHRYTRVGHGPRRYWNPVPDDAMDTLLAELPLRQTPWVVDIGCGRGEALRVLSDRFGAVGLAIEPDAQALAAVDLPGVERVAARFTPQQLTRPADAILSIGVLPWADLAPLGAHLAPGGVLVVGDGVLTRPAHPDYAAFYGDLPPLLVDWRARAEAAGWRVVRERLATQAEWDRYEECHAARIRAWCDRHPDHPEVEAWRARVDAWHGTYRRHGRGTLGFGVFVLRRRSN